MLLRSVAPNCQSTSICFEATTIVNRRMTGVMNIVTSRCPRTMARYAPTSLVDDPSGIGQMMALCPDSGISTSERMVRYVCTRTLGIGSGSSAMRAAVILLDPVALPSGTVRFTTS